MNIYFYRYYWNDIKEDGLKVDSYSGEHNLFFNFFKAFQFDGFNCPTVIHREKYLFSIKKLNESEKYKLIKWFRRDE
jgi:hypothetical protein